ncbi:MAG: hypothetical protein IH889_03600 [Planctomycetes bacterium]|nr:hypothetical protein [Planctomycetota bacterium]
MKLFGTRRLVAASAVGLGIVFGGAPETSFGLVVAGQDQPDEEVLLNQARGEAALAEARVYMGAHRWQRAIDAFETALRYLPGNEDALAGLRQAQAQLDEASAIGDVDQERQVQLGRAREEFDVALRRAGELLAQQDFAGAEREVLTAQIRLRRVRNLFSDREHNERNRQAENLLVEIDVRRTDARLAEDHRIRLEADRAQKEARIREGQQRRSIITENLLRVRQLQLELKYDEALQVVDEILFIDEYNPAALVLRDTIRNTMLYREYAELQRRKDPGYAVLSLDGQRAMVPPQPNVSGPGERSTTGVMQYPEDWAQLSLRRTHEAGFGESPANQRVAQILSQTRIPVDFSRNSFDQVISFLSQVTGVDIYVDWKALDFIGVDPSDEITLQLNDVAVATALERILEQAGDDLDRPQWSIQDGILTISSEEKLRTRTHTLVYDIRDLLFEVPYFGNAPELNLATALNQGGGGGGFGGGGAGGGGFGGGGGGGRGGGGGGGGGGGSIFSPPGDEPPRLTRQELVGQIIDIIQDNIDPDGWRDLGGDTGSLQELNGNLIITNTLRSHRTIEGLLSQLREIRALQINVESRFLTVSADWFEQIGVDLDLYFNTNNTLRQRQLGINPQARLSDFFGPDGQLLDPYIPIPPSIFLPPDTSDPPDGIGDTVIIGPTAPIQSTQGFPPIGFVQDSIGLLGQIADLEGTAALAVLNPALALSIQFLDDVQVDLLIEATQADKRSVVLTAPRLTFFNGQRAWVAVARQVAFISALTALTGDAVGVFLPIPGVVSEGVVLDVEGVISADRRYVTMTVIVSLSEILGIRELAVQGAVGAGGLGGGAGATFLAVQELPEVEVSLVQTTVSVPDKGTVLLGGQRLVKEVEVETGVPVLSKIPFINRFFTNRLTSKTEETLLILIRPEIIIQQENEDLLFPGLSDSLGGAAAYLR